MKRDSVAGQSTKRARQTAARCAISKPRSNPPAFAPLRRGSTWGAANASPAPVTRSEAVRIATSLLRDLGDAVAERSPIPAAVMRHPKSTEDALFRRVSRLDTVDGKTWINIGDRRRRTIPMGTTAQKEIGIRLAGLEMNRDAIGGKPAIGVGSGQDAIPSIAQCRKLIAAFTAAVCLSSLIGVASYWSVSRARADEAWVAHTYEVLDALDLVLSRATDAESAGRGFAITGRDDFLQPYIDSTEHFKNDLRNLQALTVDNAAQQRRYTGLEELMVQRMAFSKQVIDERRSHGFEAAVQLVDGGQGQAIQGAIRRIVAEMDDDERALLTQRRADSDQYGRAASLIIIMGSALTFAIAFAALILVRRDFAGAQHARTALARANAELEARVTERTAELSRMSKRLGRANQELRSLVVQAPLAIAMFDRTMTYVAASRRWVIEFGNGRDDLVGLNHYDLLPDIPQVWIQAHRRGLAGETVTNENDVWVHADGSKHWLRWALSPWHDEHGEIGGITILSEDVTKEQLAQQAMRESEARLSGIFNSTMDAVISIDDHQQIRLFNPAAASMFGWSINEVIGQPLDRLIPGRLRQAHERHVSEYAQTGVATRRMGGPAEISGLRASGEEFPIEASISQVESGGTKLLTVILRDITARKKAEAELAELRMERERLREFQVASQTAISIAHELNQPLTAIMSYSEATMLMLRAGNPEPDKLESALERSAQQAKRAGRVMRELIEHFHKGEVRTEAVDLDEVIRNATAIVGSAGYAGFEVIVETAENLRPVLANRAQLEKVVINLLRNGAEAALSAGASAPIIRVAIRADAEDRMAQVTISDNGPGIDEDLAERIFEPLFTTKPRGVGMGLTVSRSLVEAHGGRLWVDLSAGPGATFHFTLPFAS